MMGIAITLVAVDFLEGYMYLSRHTSSKEQTMKHGLILLQLQKKILSEAFILFENIFFPTTESSSVSYACLKIHVF